MSRGVAAGFLAGILLTAALLLFAGSLRDRPTGAATAEAFGVRVGERVPDVHFTTLDGATGRLGDFQGWDAVVLVIRDTACPASTRYGPRLALLEERYAAEGVRFIYVNLGPHQTPGEMHDEIKSHGLAGPYVHDPDGVFGRALHVRATTEVFVLDPSLTLMYRGAIDDQYGIDFTRPEVTHRWLEDALDAVLGGEAPAVRTTEVPGSPLRFAQPAP